MTMAALCRTRAASWTSTSRGKGQGTTELRCGEVRVVGEGLVCMGINTITGWTIPPVQSCSRGKGQGSTELLWEGASVVGAPAAGSELSRWKSRIAEERGQDCIVPARPGQDRQISHAALFPPTVSYVARCMLSGFVQAMIASAFFVCARVLHDLLSLRTCAPAAAHRPLFGLCCKSQGVAHLIIFA